MKTYKKWHENETDIKHAVKDWLNAKGVFNYHLLAGIGAFKGCPDRVAHHNGRVIYLEIKQKKGKLSHWQEIFQEQCLSDNIDYFVIRDVDKLSIIFN